MLLVIITNRKRNVQNSSFVNDNLTGSGRTLYCLSLSLAHDHHPQVRIPTPTTKQVSTFQACHFSHGIRQHTNITDKLMTGGSSSSTGRGSSQPRMVSRVIVGTDRNSITFEHHDAWRFELTVGSMDEQPAFDDTRKLLAPATGPTATGRATPRS